MKSNTSSNTTALFKSKKQNRYIFDMGHKKTILCHPLFSFLVELNDQGHDLEQWMSGLNETGIEIKECGLFSKNEIEYYYKKFRMLKDNGYFKTNEHDQNLDFRMTADDVKRSLANTPQITFEVTDRCGLQCEYCGYGKFYNDYDTRDNIDMTPDTAKRLIDYMAQLWNSPLHLSHDKNIYIGFYGGEPLMNFPFIREIVDYVKKLNVVHNHFTFSITTNGLLLDKYMDFLVSNEFNMLISLDGDETGNGYRVYKNGKPAYNDIMKNIMALKSKFPSYFEEKVRFNAVLHNMNTVPRIHHFFKTTFGKFPGVSLLNTSGIAENQLESFRKLFSFIDERNYKPDEYRILEKDMFLNLPNTQKLSLFLHKENDFAFEDYNELIYLKESQTRFPIGTCMPFSKKVFITVNGKIFPCERIGHQHVLGYISPTNGVSIDFEAIAQKYTSYFLKLKKQCLSCYCWERCSQCVLSMDSIREQPVCDSFMTRETYSHDVSSCIDSIEQSPLIYGKILKKVVVE